jgi:hypothetical protein
MAVHEADGEAILDWVCALVRGARAELEAPSRITGIPEAQILEEICRDFEERRQRGFGPRE